MIVDVVSTRREIDQDEGVAEGILDNGDSAYGDVEWRREDPSTAGFDTGCGLVG